MKILHIAQNSKKYEEVTLLANQIDRTNSFHAIEKNGEQYYTGGFLINDTPQIRAILDAIPDSEQYEFVKSFKMDPFVKFYLNDK